MFLSPRRNPSAASVGHSAFTAAFLCLVAALLFSPTARAIDDYKLGPLSMEQAGVPKGRVIAHTNFLSKVFTNTTRDWWVYVPAQYDAKKPAAVMIFQDGHDYVGLKGAWRVPTVFDNLIHRGEMPVTIGIFINPGHELNRGSLSNAWRASNRSFEYDSLGDRYSKFLISEILPAVAKDFNLTTNAEARAICGASSGAICAFTVAWERPDQFRKVLSTIGSFVDLRGGHVYPYLIRKTERKPIRVFLQDGANDLDNPFGNWPLANQMMAASLRYMDYDYKFVLGDGQHNSKHGASIFPETCQWLWRDWKEKGL
jgi:predicted alpha/beta superfamily hydrolase